MWTSRQPGSPDSDLPPAISSVRSRAGRASTRRPAPTASRRWTTWPTGCLTTFRRLRARRSSTGTTASATWCSTRETTRLAGVLDWELATLGDPFADLAYLCMGYHHEPPGRPGLVAYPGGGSGIPPESELLHEYCRLAGIDEVPHWRVYLAFSFFRLAAILQGVYRRGLEGNAASREALSKRALVRVCAETGWRLRE